MADDKIRSGDPGKRKKKPAAKRRWTRRKKNAHGKRNARRR